jgi:hypothetical protein
LISRTELDDPSTIPVKIAGLGPDDSQNQPDKSDRSLPSSY